LRTHWKTLHERPADDLGRREIIAILEPYAGRVTAAQMLRHLSACLSWGLERELLERNAALGIKPPVQRAARERVLSDNEIRAIWLATDPSGAAAGAQREFHAIIRLLLLLGQRRQEVGGMLWAELDLGRELWRLPAERTKNHKPHDVPLPRQAVDVLSAQRKEGETTHVFGRHDRGFATWDRCKADLDRTVSISSWVVHDLRRTAITGMAEIGIQPHVIEAIVNHTSGHKAGVAGVYNRAEYAAEKRAALKRWADHLNRIVAGAHSDNVVEFGR
jgi:integrase